ncbi:MAG: helicase DnaB [Cyanobium sp. CACIAM 14]|nr:MAG: helicase DnaB [Cyanobium sp. CACIAM 14]
MTASAALAGITALLHLGTTSRPLPLAGRPLPKPPGMLTAASVGSGHPRWSPASGGELARAENRADPTLFTPEELQQLQRKFGVHGEQPALAQLFTEGLDDLAPLRSHTLGRLAQLRPAVLEASRRRRLNPMLVAAILFDEMQHAKPGKDEPIAAHSGLFRDHGPAQLSISELVHQGLLKPDSPPEEVDQAINRLLDPHQSVELLAGQLDRLRRLMGFPSRSGLNVSGDPRDAKITATLAYLHNGKLDYPIRILRYMQDPEIHAIIYGTQERPLSALI